MGGPCFSSPPPLEKGSATSFASKFLIINLSYCFNFSHVPVNKYRSLHFYDVYHNYIVMVPMDWSHIDSSIQRYVPIIWYYNPYKIKVTDISNSSNYCNISETWHCNKLPVKTTKYKENEFCDNGSTVWNNGLQEKEISYTFKGYDCYESTGRSITRYIFSN